MLLPGQALAAAKDGLASVGRVQQQGVDHRPAPMRLAGWAGDIVRMQPSADRRERQTLLPDPNKDLADDTRRILVDDVARSAATCLARDVVIAVGRAGQNTDGARLGTVAFATATAFQRSGSLILREHAL